MTAIQSSASRRDPDVFGLIYNLQRFVNAATENKGVADGTTFPFSSDNFETVLQEQGIAPQDCASAIDHMVDHGLLERRGENIHLTSRALTEFNMTMRRM